MFVQFGVHKIFKVLFKISNIVLIYQIIELCHLEYEILIKPQQEKQP